MANQAEIKELFDIAVNRYGAMIRRVCRSYATERASADDLYQEVMAAIWVGLSAFRGRSSLSTWIYRVTLNTCISYLRRLDSRTLYDGRNEWVDLAEDMPHYGRDEYECLNYLISCLSPIDKALILMWLDERPYSEISDVTGLSVNVVGTRLTRIRNRLKQLWQAEFSSKQ